MQGKTDSYTLLIFRDGFLHLPHGEAFPCRMGRGGLIAAEAKREGDLCTPIGTWALRAGYYRADRIARPQTALPLRALTPTDGWCDDPAHPLYNHPITLPFEARHEQLWRDDHVYDIIIPLGYNDGKSGKPIAAGHGSAIFLHLARPDGVGTEGCLALAYADLLTLLRGCDEKTQVKVV